MLGKSQEVSRMAYYHPLSFSVHNTLVYLWYYYRNSSPIKVQRYSSFLTLFPPQVPIFESAAKGSHSSEGFSTDTHYIHQVLLKYLFSTHFCSHFSPLLPPSPLLTCGGWCYCSFARSKAHLLLTQFHLGQLSSWTSATDFLGQEDNRIGICFI